MAGTSVGPNLEKIEFEIAKSCRLAGRSRGDVTLIAVSKTKPIAMIQEAMRFGQRDFAENYVQEAVEKVTALPKLHWHFIGTLQTNKVKAVVGKVALIHSVDRLRLANEISEAALKIKRVQDVLLQVKVGDEETKHGVSLAEAPDLMRAMLEMPGIRVRGMMCLPPVTEDEETGRHYFSLVADSAERYRSDFLSVQQRRHFNVLSMGTTHDFHWAIQEGATHIRVGTAIFGARGSGRVAVSG